MIRTTLFLCFVTFCTSLLVVSTLSTSLAQVMQSGNFQIQSDSVNFGGGFSSSTNYRVESTAGEIATGESGSTNYNLYAGYQQMQDAYIALSGATDIVMTPTISGVVGGTSNGSTTVTVITDSPAGYSLSIQASNNPAMQSSSATIDDYTPAGNPDYTFTTASGDSHLGYSPEGVDTVTRFKDNGSACNVGALNGSGTCWDGLATTAETIASGSNPNHPSGATTTVFFRVGVGASAGQAPGTYTATTTLTALAL